MNVVAWDEVAEAIAEKIHKGAQVAVQGRLKVEKYPDSRRDPPETRTATKVPRIQILTDTVLG